MTRWLILRVAVSALLVAALTSAARAQAGVADVNGVRLPYEVAGSGKPLVLIHGWAVDRRYWAGDIERLARKYRVVRYDRRGFGDATGRPDLSADAADLKAMLRTLGIDRAILVGHSQGAGVALTAAVRYPDMVDALILFGPGPPDGLQLAPGPDALPIGHLIAVGKTHGVDSMRAVIGAWAAAAFGDSLGSEPGAASDLLAKYDGQDLLDPAPPLHLADPARIDEVGAVRAPTLVLRGAREMPAIRIVADTLTHGIPGAVQVVIPGGGHAVNWSEPERFAAEVLRFLRRVQ